MLCRPILGIWGKWLRSSGRQIETNLVQPHFKEKETETQVSQIVQITEPTSVRGDLGTQSPKHWTLSFLLHHWIVSSLGAEARP